MSFSDATSMKETLNVIHAVVNTERILPSEGVPSAKIRLAAREAALGGWLVKALSNRDPTEHGDEYIMPNSADDVIVVLPNLRVGEPLAGTAAHTATPEDLDDIVKAARILGNLERVRAYPSGSALVWRGTVPEKQFMLWLLRQFADPPATDWIDPVSEVLPALQPGKIDLFYFPPHVTYKDLQTISETVRRKARIGRIATLMSQRTIAIYGTNEQVTQAEAVVAELRKGP